MVESKISIQLSEMVKAGDSFMLYATDTAPVGAVASGNAGAGLRAGDRLEGDGASFLVQSVSWLPGGAEQRSTSVYLLRAEADMTVGEYVCSMGRTGYALAWITLSDKGSRGERVDESGPLIGKQVGEKLDLDVVQGFVIPDETDQLKGLMVDLALNQGFDLIMTTGGTGVAPRDITPEATLAVIEKRLPGFERAMTAASLVKTPHGAISRAVAGTLGQAIIVNMPGSPKAVAECLEPLLPTLRHTLEKLQGDPSDCANL